MISVYSKHSFIFWVPLLFILQLPWRLESELWPIMCLNTSCTDRWRNEISFCSANVLPCLYSSCVDIVWAWPKHAVQRSWDKYKNRVSSCSLWSSYGSSGKVWSAGNTTPTVKPLTEDRNPLQRGWCLWLWGDSWVLAHPRALSSLSMERNPGQDQKWGFICSHLQDNAFFLFLLLYVQSHSKKKRQKNIKCSHSWLGGWGCFKLGGRETDPDLDFLWKRMLCFWLV